MMSTLKLSAEQLELYHENGYVIVPNVFGEEELAAIDADINKLEEEKRNRIPYEDLSGWVLQLGLRSEVAGTFARDERILSLIEDLVKPGIAIYSSKLAAKPPHSDIPCHWHQDDAYYVQNSDSKTRLSIWVPLTDATEDNGCLWIVPGSHKWGLQEHETKNYGTCRFSFTKEPDPKDAIPVPVAAGSMVIFHALLWHGSKGNHTDEVRRAFIVSYQEATVPKGNGKQWQIIRPA